MKYKVLLAGNSKKLISNFFLQMDFAFECMTSSMIFEKSYPVFQAGYFYLLYARGDER